MTVFRARMAPLIGFLLLIKFSASAQDLDLIGNVSWYQLGRGVEIRAEEVANTAPGGLSGFLRLQVWATETPYGGESVIDGEVFARLNLGRLRGGFSFFNVSAVVRYLQPTPGIYYTTITLEEEQPDGSFVIVDYETFADPVNLGGYGAGIVEDIESTGDITFVGDVYWQSGDNRVELFAERIQNERASGRSGVLRMRLWATSTPYGGGGTLQGWPLATRRVGRVSAGFFIPDFNTFTFFRPPPPDEEYYITLTLEEFVRRRWEIVDYVTFPGTSLF